MIRTNKNLSDVTAVDKTRKFLRFKRISPFNPGFLIIQLHKSLVRSPHPSIFGENSTFSFQQLFEVTLTWHLIISLVIDTAEEFLLKFNFSLELFLGNPIVHVTHQCIILSEDVFQHTLISFNEILFRQLKCLWDLIRMICGVEYKDTESHKFNMVIAPARTVGKKTFLVLQPVSL